VPSIGSHPDLPVPLLGVRVLIVEDDLLAAKLASSVLRREGCDVRIAPDAEEALAVMRSFDPAVAILDLILPGMSGLVLAEIIKADPRLRHVTLVAATGFDGKELERMILQAGCATLLTKPIPRERLIAALRTCLAAGSQPS
jgi:CheY-like chemotaxis protein